MLRKYRQHIYLWTRSTFSKIVCMKAESIQKKKHVIYELFAYLPLLRRMLKNNILLIFSFSSTRRASFETSFAFIGDFHWKKKHQQKSRKCAMSNRWMRAHPLKHKYNDIKCPNIKMWIDINNQDGCVRLISTKSDPNVNKTSMRHYKNRKKLFFFWKLLIFFCAVSNEEKKFMLPVSHSASSCVFSWKSRNGFLLFFCCCWWRKSFYFHFNAHPFYFYSLRSDFDVRNLQPQITVTSIASFIPWERLQQLLIFRDKLMSCVPVDDDDSIYVRMKAKGI